MSPPRDRWLAIIYAAAIFTSAFLLFQIQPLVSKRILPWFGGTPAVWTTCLLFFQTVLFAGYAYAHWSNSRLKPKQQAFVHAALILIALLLMHALPGDQWEPTGGERPIPRILLILTASIGLPYFVLSATGPLLQAWFARAFPGRIPYRLYALSNVGSLLALASYPFFFEPAFNLAGQAWLWSSGFVIYAALCAFIAWHMYKASVGQAVPDTILAAGETPLGATNTSQARQAQPDLLTSLPPTLPLYFFWLILAAFASIVLIAMTNHISIDIAVMPLLWVVPLALYLLTFIIAFDRPAWYRRVPVALLAVVSTYAAAVTHHFGIGSSMLYELGTFGRALGHFANPDQPPPEFNLSAVHFLIANFATVFAVCLLCHGEIVRTRPAPQYLTSFYLTISAGGALGGIFATLVAPLLFTTYFEWDVTLFIACLASLVAIGHAGVDRFVRSTGRQSGAGLTWGRRYLPIGVGALALVAASVVLLVDVTEFLGSATENVQWAARNFFGTLRIHQTDSDDPEWARNLLVHGTTTHGSQFTLASRRREPTTYYGHETGVGRTIDYFHEHLPPGGLRMAVVGLGAGTLAAYPDAGDSITFYEINPVVIKLIEGNRWFTYLHDCRDRGAHCEIHLGDARLTLKHELQSSASTFQLTQTLSGSPPHSAEGLREGRATEKLNSKPSYHVLALDAFSGDSVPAHLLTVEAFELYQKSLSPRADGAGKPAESGAIAVHISNHFLDLEPVVRALQQRFNFLSLRFDTSDDPEHDGYGADWIILTHNANLASALKGDATPVDVAHPPVLWTDTRSSLFEILK